MVVAPVLGVHIFRVRVRVLPDVWMLGRFVEEGANRREENLRRLERWMHFLQLDEKGRV